MKSRSWFRRWPAVLTRAPALLGWVSLAGCVRPGRSSSTADIVGGSFAVTASLSHGTPGLITGVIIVIITGPLATVFWTRALGQDVRTLRWLLSHMNHPTPQDRHERLVLTCAALRGAIAGAVHAIVSWLLNHLAS